VDTVIERVTAENIEERIPVDRLFQVWFDVNCGFGSPDWWWNSPPQSLPGALTEAADSRLRGYPTKVMPEGVNPRPDGRWDNPV
jgi:hypothetical protein